MIFASNLFNASHKISRNYGANLRPKNRDLRIQCMKCEGYGHIKTECANTWSNDEFEACNEGEDIFNESVAPLVSLFIVEQCLSDMKISVSGPPVDPSTDESPAFNDCTWYIRCCDN